MNFDQAFAALIPVEGGYVNDPLDPGGETKYGISKRSYPNEDIAGMTLDRAKLIYQHDYWAQSGCDLAPDGMKYELFDTGVNSSPREARVLLQMALGVATDGVIGPQTLMAMQSMNVDKLRRHFDGHRLIFLKGLANWNHDSAGWVTRIAQNLLRD